jgi:hypothetical protein
MPKVDIDYSNTIIYKIVCKDPLITDVYVGHTTNFVQRKYAHKQTCNNIKSPYYNLKLYKTIRSNGDWSNWDMTIIQFYNCKDLLEARHKEQEFFIALNATLNSIEPLPSKINISPKNSQIYTVNSNITENNDNKYNCKICDYSINKKSSYDKHLLAAKHVCNSQKIQEEGVKMLSNVANGSYKCVCNKVFKYHSGIWRHKRTCTFLTEKKSPEPIVSAIYDNEMIKLLINECSDFRNTILDQNNIILNQNKIILELVKKGSIIPNNTSSTNL